MCYLLRYIMKTLLRKSKQYINVLKDPLCRINKNLKLKPKQRPNNMPNI